VKASPQIAAAIAISPAKLPITAWIVGASPTSSCQIFVWLGVLVVVVVLIVIVVILG
jgi:hypothetical protein